MRECLWCKSRVRESTGILQEPWCPALCHTIWVECSNEHVFLRGMWADESSSGSVWGSASGCCPAGLGSSLQTALWSIPDGFILEPGRARQQCPRKALRMEMADAQEGTQKHDASKGLSLKLA